jgi:chemotaxis protein CheD
MKEIVDVNTGEIRLGTGNTVLRSLAIGSCIAIAVRDARQRIAALAHVMLPGTAPATSADKLKYVADAIDEMISRMTEAGSAQRDIEACLVGAGNVLQKEDDMICAANIESTLRVLKERKIPIRATDLGGTERKAVFLDVESGSISYRKGDGQEKLLWKPTV